MVGTDNKVVRFLVSVCTDDGGGTLVLVVVIEVRVGVTVEKTCEQTKRTIQIIIVLLIILHK